MQLVILDRAGVIDSGSGATGTSGHEWQAIPGSLEALARLSGAGYRLVIATNQPGPRRKSFDIESLISAHHAIQHDLLEAGSGVDAVFFCACLPGEACECMMPSPGMLQEIAARLRISLGGVPVIGASMAAVDAALSGGARPMFVRTGSRDDVQAADSRGDVECYDDLGAAVDQLIAETAPA